MKGKILSEVGAFLFILAFVIGLVIYTITYYYGLPIVKFSVSQSKIVAVESADGKHLPLSPLPKKYEIINVR